MSTLTNLDIPTICAKLKIPLIQCCCKDQLKIKNEGGYIINLANSFDAEGTHWTAVFFKNKQLFYFDSFGFIFPKEVGKFRRLTTIKKIYYSQQQIQNLPQHCCGWYCILFLKYMISLEGELTSRYEKFLELFSSDFSKNDDILENKLEELFRKK
jgi:hypothetical protein